MKNIDTKEKQVVFRIENENQRIEFYNWLEKDAVIAQAKLMQSITHVSINDDFRIYKISDSSNPIPEFVEMMDLFYATRNEIEAAEIISVGNDNHNLQENEWWQIFWLKFYNNN